MIFDNCLIQAPDGVNLSRCGKKKVRWYLQNGLADVVSENPTTIRLRFEPSGRCGINDPLLMTGKPNICVVCGSDENLTRHHIIPYSFIKYMQIEYKVDIIRDIFPCCDRCHHDYEKKSTEKRQEMAAKLGVPLNGINPEELRRVKKAIKAACALSDRKAKIPEERKASLQKIVCEFADKKDIADVDLKAIVKYDINKHKEFVCFSKFVADQVVDYSDFAREWREHFVATMQPKFMPSVWKVDRKTENVWVPPRMKR